MSTPVLPRLRGAAFLFGAGLVATACGSGASTNTNANKPSPTASHSSSSSSSHDSTSSDSSSDSGDDITLGDVALTSTLAPPEKRFGTSASATQDENGITLHVNKAGGSYSFSTMQYWTGIPDSFVVEVQADEATPNKLYFGVACRGLDINNTYLLLVDMSGDYAIVQVNAGKQKLLKSGEKAFTPSGTVTVDAACVTPQSDDKMNHLELVADDQLLASVDDSFENVAQSNTFALISVSPDADTGTGDVTFHDLKVTAASAP